MPGCPHHVTQRGNNRQDVFFVDDDRRVYLEFLKAQGRLFDLQVQGYCLMSERSEDPLGEQPPGFAKATPSQAFI